MRAVTDGHYKLSINLMSTDELYDLDRDPYELHNLIEDESYAEIRNRLHDAILDKMCNDRDPFRGYYWEARPWRTDAPAPHWRWRGWTRQREEEEYEPRQLDFANGLVMNHPRAKITNDNIKFHSLEELTDWLRHYDD